MITYKLVINIYVFSKVDAYWNFISYQKTILGHVTGVKVDNKEANENNYGDQSDCSNWRNTIGGKRISNEPCKYAIISRLTLKIFEEKDLNLVNFEIRPSIDS